MSKKTDGASDVGTDEHPANDNAAPPKLVIVGVGSSAGGLEALRQMLAGFPEGANVALIIAQHLSPTHSSMMTDLLDPATKLQVQEAEEGLVPQPGHVYVTPPNRNVELIGDKIVLSESSRGPGPTPSVDVLFQSLARHCGDRAVGIVLSGTGSDGASGLRSIKAAGGTTIVQDPDDAKYDGMPRAAVRSRAADVVLRADEIARVVVGLVGAPRMQVGGGTVGDDLPKPLPSITRTVKQATGFDLSQYKIATVERRLRKRMALHKLTNVEDYVGLLNRDRDEPGALVRDLLISVTEFFRDPDAFTALRGELERLLKTRHRDDVFRVWVPGCATGEEAYTLAIMLSELTRENPEFPEFLIFATDLDEAAIEFGRAGEYPQTALSRLDEQLRERYFVPQEQHFVVARSLRQSVVFAVQNLLSDPPFSRLDLISCRNLLIYFTKDAQKSVLDTFSYALKPDGRMFLGHSESIDLHGDGFRELDRKARIYCRRGSEVSDDSARPSARRADSNDPPPPGVFSTRLMSPERNAKDQMLPRRARLMQALVEQYCPPSVIVDDDNRVLHLVGAVSTFLSMESGPAPESVLDLVGEDLRIELRALLSKCRREGATVQGSVFEHGGEPVQVVVRPLADRSVRLWSISFSPPPAARTAGGDGTEQPSEPHGLSGALIIQELENEMSELRTRLQTVVEELETSNEELQSQSEELQSSNEELQSTNEELQTSNEELQSTNEELLTVNDELKVKSDELETVASALRNVKESLSFPLLVVDEHMVIRNRNMASATLTETGEPPESGEPLVSQPWMFDVIDVLPAVRRVIMQREPANTTVTVESGETYELRCMPFVDANNVPEGVVMVFANVSARAEAELALKQANRDLRNARDRIQITLESISEGLITTDTARVITYANPTATALLGVDQQTLVGQHLGDFWRLRPEDDADDAVLDPLSRALVEREPVRTTGQYFLELPSGDSLAIDSSAAPLFHERPGQPPQLVGAVLAFRDMTSQRLLTEELSYRAAHDPLTGVLNRDEFERRAESALRDAQTDHSTHVLLYADLDQFKIVNDTVGHSAGDELLKQVCELFRGKLRQADVLARLGGDEFGMILRNCTEEDGARVGKSMVDALESYRFTWGEQQFTIGASVGLALLHPDLRSVAEALSAADSACYAAKEAGRGRVHNADGTDTRPSRQLTDMRVITQLNEAMDENRMVLQVEQAAEINDLTKRPYQELLLRMRDSDDKIVPPSQFIPAAERYYLMGRVDRWVFDHAVDRLQAEARTADGSENRVASVTTSINISGQTIGDARFLEHARERLSEANLPPGALCIEITETAAISQLSDAIRLMQSLKSLGVRFALDDFGAGMSSFSYLRSLPVNYVKIDGVFVRNLQQSTVDRAIVEVVCKIARELRLTVVAEHVEDETTRAMLETLGVSLIQGRLVGIADPKTL